MAVFAGLTLLGTQLVALFLVFFGAFVPSSSTFAAFSTPFFSIVI